VRGERSSSALTHRHPPHPLSLTLSLSSSWAQASESTIARCYRGARIFQWFRAAPSSGGEGSSSVCSGGAGRCDAGVVLLPARSQTVMLPAVDVEDSGEYWCTLDTIVIARVVLRVLGAPEVSNTFRHVTSKVGEKVSFVAEMSRDGAPLIGPHSFQWQRNGLAIPGATQREFKLKSVARRHEGTYHCEVQNMMATSMWGEIVLSIAKEEDKEGQTNAEAAAAPLASAAPAAKKALPEAPAATAPTGERAPEAAQRRAAAEPARAGSPRSSIM
jgi:hypothetical protein